ncbi:transposase [Actinosynnema sp. CA-299493]
MKAGRKVNVVADRHPVHRSKAVRVWLDADADRVELYLTPGYSRALNPDELPNADLKGNVDVSRAHNVDRLAHETRRFLHRRERQPHLVRSCFQAPHACHAIVQEAQYFLLNN